MLNGIKFFYITLTEVSDHTTVKDSLEKVKTIEGTRATIMFYLSKILCVKMFVHSSDKTYNDLQLSQGESDMLVPKQDLKNSCYVAVI